MRLNKSLEEVNSKCVMLMDLGFEINHRDCDLSFATHKHNLHGFDFSSTSPEIRDILYAAISHAYTLGFEKGKEDIQQRLKDLLGLEEYNK